MASRASGSVVKMKKCDLQQANGVPGALFSKISQLKKEIQTSRYYSVKEKLRRNSTIVNISTFHLGELSKSKEVTDQDRMTNMLSFRTVNPLSKISGYTHGAEEKDVNILEITPSTTSKLPLVEKIPPYTTWIFLDKNQRMSEDQSVVGRRQIYYDQDGGETLISSDSEEEIAEPEELKREFSEGEDQLLWKALQEYGSEEEVLNMLSQFVEATSSEILDRYTILMDRYQGKHAQSVEPSAENLSTCFERSLFLDKSLNAALDSFDTLFCRRCLVFDCRLHGCSQPIITPGEKQQYRCELVENKIACSDHCYLRKRRTFTDVCGSNDTHTICTIERDKTLLSSRNEEQSPDHLNQGIILDKTGNDGRSADMSFGVSIIPNVSLRSHSDDQLSSTRSSPANSGKRKVLKHVSITVQSPKIGPYDCQGSSSKKQKTVSGSDVIYVSVDGKPESSVISKVDIRIPGSGELDGNTRETSHGKQFIEHRNHGSVARDIGHDNVELDINTGTEVLVPSMEHSASFQGQDHASQGCAWGAFEKELYLKGIEIFGENSCLISRNLLSGLKTCIEVYTYMLKDGYALASSTFPSSSMEHNGKAEADNKQEMPARSRIFRRRGKARKLKYTWKTGAHPSAHKRIAGSKNIWNKQYTPCDCKSICGKECPCTKNETCCEKYCGCSKNCKYRFRGCHCAKSQCRSRQCPCFAADRECDPDVCRNCWVSCGDGSIDVPPAKGDDYKCENMKLLLKQQQRILLGKSDVAGWGAFLKNPVNKNDYLGEYTGEIISHKEADKRGKIYDRSNSSYLFDLNDQGVLDAYRKGDKLKFANHSAKPNCFAKVKMVAGDHRVGIYALENIEAGEELFYDYCYAPDTHYVWARKAESSKKDESAGPSRRARKHQSMLLG